MAVLTALATVPILLAREPSTLLAAKDGHGASVHFLRRPGAARLLLLIVAYKTGDAFATGMLRPFLADAGLSLTDIGWLLGTVGFVAGLLGALTGGMLVNRLGRKEALTWFGLLQAASVAGYAYLALGTPSQPALYVLCGAEHFAGGMATAALFTCMMDWCSPETSGTDYTVQASAVVIVTGAASDRRQVQRAGVWVLRPFLPCRRPFARGAGVCAAVLSDHRRDPKASRSNSGPSRDDALMR